MALDLDRGIALTWHPDLAGIDPGHVNSVLCAIDDRRRQSRCALLFPGDIMQEQRLINPHFNEWSFEQAAVKFLTNDPSIGMVALIKPSKRIGEVSCFANFASVSQVGSAKLYDKFGNTSVSIFIFCSCKTFNCQHCKRHGGHLRIVLNIAIRNI
uniref:Uncharacterized protein n=1 Tax=Spongospora subterranea TaxID=70186 RepID=A0A0H5QGW3_9EUKA|eukprot:CRZ01243.1 hypothetical protein [Spongospora subterranea]